MNRVHERQLISHGLDDSLRQRTKLLHNPLDSASHSVNDPPMSLATIRNEIEKLEPAERASLIDLLWDSLDDDSVHQIEAKWAAESEDRIGAFERGELEIGRAHV